MASSTRTRRPLRAGAPPQSAVFWLLGMTALSVTMMLGRVVYTGEPTHVHILWNLFLAWLPLGFAYLAFRLPRVLPLVRLGSGLFWVLFLPNAPYLVTDLMHLPRGNGIPVLFDVLLLFSTALCGLLLGLVSLQWMVSSVARRVGAWIGRIAGMTVLGATGFGIYVGRYLRWNSWDVVTNPVPLMRDIWAHVCHPLQNWQAWAFASLFAILLMLAHESLLAVGRRTPY